MFLLLVKIGFSVVFALFRFLFSAGMASFLHSCIFFFLRNFAGEFVKEVAINLLFIKTVAWLSLNPQIKYPKIINSDFFLAFSPLQNIVIILLRPVLSKNKKTKKKLIIIIKVVKKS